LGYAAWFKAVDRRGSDPLVAFLGVVSQGADQDRGFVLLEASGNISNARVFERLLVVAATDVDNWNRRRGYPIAIPQEGTEALAWTPGSLLLGHEWSHQVVAPADLTIEEIFGSDRKHQTLTPDTFAQREARAYEQVKQQRFLSVSRALWMEERAREFSAARSLSGLGAIELTPLRDALIAVANMTVQRDPKARQFIGEEAEDELPGPLAALVLGERVTVVSTSIEESRSASPASPPTPQSPLERTARIVLEQETPGSPVRHILRWREIQGRRWVVWTVEAAPREPLNLPVLPPPASR
jgi:hypothetical protein